MKGRSGFAQRTRRSAASARGRPTDEARQLQRLYGALRERVSECVEKQLSVTDRAETMLVRQIVRLSKRLTEEVADRIFDRLIQRLAQMRRLQCERRQLLGCRR